MQNRVVFFFGLLDSLAEPDLEARFLDVWQLKDLRARISDGWKIKELATLRLGSGQASERRAANRSGQRSVTVGRFGACGRLSQGILTGLLPNVNSYFMVQRFERGFGAEVIDGVRVVARPVHENAGLIRIWLASGKSANLNVDRYLPSAAAR